MFACKHALLLPFPPIIRPIDKALARVVKAFYAFVKQHQSSLIIDGRNARPGAIMSKLEELRINASVQGIFSIRTKAQTLRDSMSRTQGARLMDIQNLTCDDR
jgi:hypothetical protein